MDMHPVTCNLTAEYGISSCTNTRPTSVRLTFTVNYQYPKHPDIDGLEYRRLSWPEL